MLLLLYGLDLKLFVASQDSEHTKLKVLINIYKLDESSNYTEGKFYPNRKKCFTGQFFSKRIEITPQIHIRKFEEQLA